MKIRLQIGDGGGDAASTLSHSFNNSADFSKGLGNANGSWRLDVPDHKSSVGSILARGMSQQLPPSRVSEEPSGGFCDQESSIENCSDHVAMKAGASQTNASQLSEEESDYKS
jgi:hypothetical protein